jgi:hypothetical protein
LTTKQQPAMKKYKLHRDLAEAIFITLGILIAFTALAFTTVKKDTVLKQKNTQAQTCSTNVTTNSTTSISENSFEAVGTKVRIYDEKGNLISEMDKTSENEQNFPKGAELVMSLDGIEYYVVVR